VVVVVVEDLEGQMHRVEQEQVAVVAEHHQLLHLLIQA
jgi:hypothetical protein